MDYGLSNPIYFKVGYMKDSKFSRVFLNLAKLSKVDIYELGDVGIYGCHSDYAKKVDKILTKLNFKYVKALSGFRNITEACNEYSGEDSVKLYAENKEKDLVVELEYFSEPYKTEDGEEFNIVIDTEAYLP